MKTVTASVIIFLLFCVVYSSVPARALIERNLPPGWIFRDFNISDSNLKALCLLPDVPEDVRLTGNIPRRVQVFDHTNDLIADLTMEDGFSFRKFTRNDRIILCDGEEGGCFRMKVLEPSGKEKYTIQADERWPVSAPFGKDIALVPGPEDIGPISIIDEDTGQEKARLDPPTNNGRPFKVAAFLPVGENGLYVQGIGATLYLKSYLHVGDVYWQIQDIGGNIKGGMFLNDEYLAISYGKDDFHNNRFTAGITVVEWRTGTILFKKEGSQINGVKDSWFSRLNARSVFLDEGSLYFYGNSDDVLRFPKQPDGRKGWNQSELKRVKLSPDQAAGIIVGDRVIEPIVQAGKYVIKNFGDVVRIERSKYYDVQ